MNTVYEQEIKIERFFEEYYRVRKWDKQSYNVVCGIFAMIQILLMIFPIQDLWMEENYSFLIYMISMLSIYTLYFYMMSYRLIKEGQQNELLSQKLRYLPVDKRVFKIWKTRLLFRFATKIFLASLTTQLLFSVIIVHGISWKNIVYVVMVTFLVPVLSNCLFIWLEK